MPEKSSSFTYPLTAGGGHWGTTDDFTTSCLHFSALHCPLGLGNLQACPFPGFVLGAMKKEREREREIVEKGNFEQKIVEQGYFKQKKIVEQGDVKQP